MTNYAGKFFVLGFDGATIPASLKRVCARHGLAGVVLFDRNIESPEQLKRLTRELQSLSDDGSLIVAIDQEGGRFQRLKPPVFPAFPPACEIEIESALALGRRMGQQLAQLGINVDLAPVLDVNTNPRNPIIGERSFGSDPQHVVRVGKLFVKGLQDKGVVACGKHFPGHGDTDQDSHLTLPVVDHPIERLRAVELVPFRALIEAGLQCLMTAHVLYPALDTQHPATFSEMILGNLLREELGFQGLIITDDMGMAGSLSQADVPEACVQAFAAGCDLLLVCEHHDRHERIIEALGEAIDRSAALQERAGQSLERLRRVIP